MSRLSFSWRRPALLGLAVLVAAGLIGTLGLGAHAAREEARLAAAGMQRVAELRGVIRLLDETLTASVRLHAATAQPRWAERAALAEAELDAALAEARRLAPPDLARRLAETTEDANRRLIALEREAMVLVRLGRPEAAAALLDGPDYAEQKARYADGLSAFAEALERLTTARAEAAMRRAWSDTGLLVLAVGLLATALLALRTQGRLRRALARNEEVARTDPLTGLLNRRGLAERLDAALAHAVGQGVRDRRWPVALLYIDLDRFKAVNDAWGHAAGDRLLVEIARRMRAELRDGDTLGRFGGDEFAVVASLAQVGFDGAAQAGVVAERIGARLVAAVAAPVEISPGILAHVGASIGIAVAPDDGAEAIALMRAADTAMYAAKSEGRGRVRRFDPQLESRARSRAALEAELRVAMAEGQVEPHFQPQYALLGGRRLVGFEVLARWRHPTRGLVPPALFIPVAEDAGLIGPMTETLLRQSAAVATGWPAGLSLSVNVSPLQLLDRGLPRLVRAALADTGLDPWRLELELTEGALLGDLALAQEVLTEVAALGVRIALDDFGTGYSSLRHLKALPINRLKVDQSFVKAMTADSESRNIVAAVVGLGQSLGLVTVAEGIEDEATAAALAGLGCDAGQGWLFGRPMPAAAATELALGRGAAAMTGAA